MVMALMYLGAVGGWMVWLDSMAPDASVWPRVGLLLASGVVWLFAAELRAVWRAKPKPSSQPLESYRRWRAEREL